MVLRGYFDSKPIGNDKMDLIIEAGGVSCRLPAIISPEVLSYEEREFLEKMDYITRFRFGASAVILV